MLEVFFFDVWVIMVFLVLVSWFLIFFENLGNCVFFVCKFICEMFYWRKIKIIIKNVCLCWRIYELFFVCFRGDVVVDLVVGCIIFVYDNCFIIW